MKHVPRQCVKRVVVRSKGCSGWQMEVLLEGCALENSATICQDCKGVKETEPIDSIEYRAGFTALDKSM